MLLKFNKISSLCFIVLYSLKTVHAETASYYIGGSFDTYVPLIQGVESAVDFYDKGGQLYSTNVPFTAEANTLHLFLYQDTTTSIVSLGLITNGFGQSGASNGSIDGTISGLGSNAYVAIADDGAHELAMSSAGSGTAIVDFTWNHRYTDGGIISGLDLDTLDLAFDFTGSTGLTSIALVGDNNNGGFGFKRYTMPASGALSFGVATAPEPGTWALMILGFVLVASRLKQKRAAGWRPAYTLNQTRHMSLITQTA